MRYLSLILFSGFLIFSIDFATQNTELVAFHYRLDWLNFSYQSERPVFVPVFFSFAFGIMFSVIYFFIDDLLKFINKPWYHNERVFASAYPNIIESDASVEPRKVIFLPPSMVNSRRAHRLFSKKTTVH